MGVIISIERVEKWTKDGVEHSRTHATVNSSRFGLIEVTGYGSGYKVGQKVEVFFDDKFNQAKMQKSKPVDNQLTYCKQ